MPLSLSVFFVNHHITAKFRLSQCPRSYKLPSHDLYQFHHPTHSFLVSIFLNHHQLQQYAVKDLSQQHFTMALTYPLPHSQKENLDAWLDTLTDVTSINSPNTRQTDCAFCEVAAYSYGPDPLPSNVRDPGESIIRLPCGCQIHRGCAIEMVHPEEYGSNECVLCRSQIFEKSDQTEESDDIEEFDDIEDFINSLRRPSISSMQEKDLDNECSICRGEYNVPNTEDPDDPTAEIEYPVQLSCNHIFGNKCLNHWLSLAEDEDPTCPTCRREVIIPRSDRNTQEPRVDLNRENIALRERLFWVRYWACHQRVHNLETADQIEDRAWLDAQVESTVANISEWIDETEDQMWERRASIRESLLIRVMDRARERLGWAAVRLVQVEMMETEGAWEVAAEPARWFGLPGF